MSADSDYDLLIRYAAGLNAPALPAQRPVSNSRRNFDYYPMGGSPQPSAADYLDGWLFFDEELGQPIWASGSSWLVSPKWLTGTALNATARGFASSVNHVWSGVTTAALTFTAAAAGVPGTTERIYFPSGTLVNLTLDSTLDPTQTLALIVNTSAKAYLLEMSYFSDTQIVSTLVKLP